jgi:hypothetical protein
MPDKVGPIPFIQNLINEGVSASEGLRQYREAEGSIRTQRWYAAYGEVAAEIAVRPNLQAAPLDVIPGAGEITQRSSTRPGGYNARGGVIVSIREVDPLTGAVSERTQTNFASLKMGSLRTYREILEGLEAYFGSEGQSGQERSSVIGSFVTAVNEMVEPSDAG